MKYLISVFQVFLACSIVAALPPEQELLFFTKPLLKTPLFGFSYCSFEPQGSVLYNGAVPASIDKRINKIKLRIKRMRKRSQSAFNNNSSQYKKSKRISRLQRRKKQIWACKKATSTLEYFELLDAKSDSLSSFGLTEVSPGEKINLNLESQIKTDSSGSYLELEFYGHGFTDKTLLLASNLVSGNSFLIQPNVLLSGPNLSSTLTTNIYRLTAQSFNVSYKFSAIELGDFLKRSNEILIEFDYKKQASFNEPVAPTEDDPIDDSSPPLVDSPISNISDTPPPYSIQSLLDKREGFAAFVTGGSGGKTYRVTSLLDSGPGTLREAAESDEPLWIFFDTDGVIALDAPIKIKSNKTIDGRGSDITVKNYGFWVDSKQNVIIENIKIRDGVISESSSADALKILHKADLVWIDHVTTSNFADELVDIGMGTAPFLFPMRITISNSHFHDHDKTMLIGSSPNHLNDAYIQLTLHHNYFDQTNQRNPRVRFATVHMYNNYIKEWGGYGVGAFLESHVCLEGNILKAGNKKNSVIYESSEGNGNVFVASTSHLHPNLLENGAVALENNPELASCPKYETPSLISANEYLRVQLLNESGWQSKAFWSESTDTNNEDEDIVRNIEPLIASAPVNSGSAGSYKSSLNATKSGVIALGLIESGIDDIKHPALMLGHNFGSIWSTAFTSPNATSQAPSVLVDNQDSIILIVKESGVGSCSGGRFLRFDPKNSEQDYQLSVDKCIEFLGTKWSSTYDRLSEIIYVSRRDKSNDLRRLPYDRDGNLLFQPSNIVENAIYEYGSTTSPEKWDIDTQYHSIVAAPDSTLHLLFNTQIHNHPLLPNNFNEKALYLYSADGGVSWKRGNGDFVPTPFSADNYVDTAQPISYYSGSDSNFTQRGYTTNILATDDKVHILAFGSSGDNKQIVFYVRLNRLTGDEELREQVPVGFHSFFVRNEETNELYIFGGELVADDNKYYPVVYKLTSDETTWQLYKKLPFPSDLYWPAISGKPTVYKDKYLLASAKYDNGINGDVIFFRVELH
ncbi:MAG: polysaccharide lyase family 1 protein [Bdellovibrionales bacterium]|nr:polysaccharide lyase family 1 protein [Bdellovibrionales bacterium]